MDLSNGVDFEVFVRSLAGNFLRFPDVSPTTLVRDIKARVREQWEVPVREQRLVLGAEIVADSRHLAGILSDTGLCTGSRVEFLLIRGPAFNFNKGLAHPRACLRPDRCELRHGGQNEYQAAFLSDILDPAATYEVPFRLYDTDGHGKGLLAEMYVGVAPDKNRNWSNLKGAYMNRKGLYVDAFCESGWLRHPRCRPWRISEMIFSHLRHRTFGCKADLFQVCDLSADGAPVEHADPSLYQVREEDNELQPACSFIMEVDMPRARLCFKTSEGTLVEELEIPELRDTPVRCCATVGYPGQRVEIPDSLR